MNCIRNEETGRRLDMNGRVLIIAGSDPSGGAGIQADIKTVTALGGYAMTAITALTVQDTEKVHRVDLVSVDLIDAQVRAVLDDIGADAIKIGMVGQASVARQIATTLKELARDIPIIFDPVLVATSGDSLGEKGMAEIFLETLLPISTLVTPNLDEAEALAKFSIKSRDDYERAGLFLCDAGASAALIKGGHGTDAVVSDLLVSANGSTVFENPRLGSGPYHGTGCTLSSAIATGLATGLSLEQSVGYAIGFVHEAIKSAPPLGNGATPLNHGHPIR